jgi:hypothetical protein
MSVNRFKGAADSIQLMRGNKKYNFRDFGVSDASPNREARRALAALERKNK